jgi:Kef-type K+ transport system membrane component KefB
VSTFAEIGFVIILAGILGFFARLVKQPLLLAYIFVGIILGPSFLNIIKNHDLVLLFSSLGIAFLLFTIGLELDIRKLKKLSFLILVVGLGQVVFTGLFGFLLSYVFGFSLLSSLYIGLALTFSSTAVVVKLLSDNKELDSLQGKFIIGTMLVQDFVAAVVLIILPGIDLSLSLKTVLFEVFFIFIKGIIFLFSAVFFGRYLISFFLRFASKTAELLFLIAVAWCLVLIFLSQKIGFSSEIGAFLAGLSLASTFCNYEIAGKIKPLRDFFLVLFFTSLGMQMDLGQLGSNWLLVLLFSLFVVLGNPLVVWIFMGLLGFAKRISFLTGLATSQVSEFSLILILLGVKLNHLDPSVVSLITSIAIITLSISSYLITYDSKIYLKISHLLNIFEPKKLRFKKLLIPEKPLSGHIILFGCDRMGSVILKNLQNSQKILVVDFNLEVVEKLKKQGILSFFGDIEDPEIIEKANLDSAKMIISTVPDFESNSFLLSQIKNKKPIIYITCEDTDEAKELYKRGADYVILPHRLSGEYVAMLFDKLGKDKSEIEKYKQKHLIELEKTFA